MTMDSLTKFLIDCCTICKEFKSHRQTFVEKYKIYCMINQLHPLWPEDVSKRLREHNIKMEDLVTKSPETALYYIGITVDYKCPRPIIEPELTEDLEYLEGCKCQLRKK